MRARLAHSLRADTGLVPFPRIILASQSPRRRELLEAAAIPHTVRVSNIDETIRAGEPPVDYVRRMAREKAFAVVASHAEIVLAADTTVVCHGQILSKPLDANEARRMLRLLSGRSHTVITGICLRYGNATLVDHDATQVWFTTVPPQDIDDYVSTGEPMDKAGGYAIQGIASRYIERIEGSYSNVVGLPMSVVWRHLQKLTTFPYPGASVPPEA